MVTVDGKSLEHTGLPLGSIYMWRRVEMADIRRQQWILLQKFGLERSLFPTLCTSSSVYWKPNISGLGSKILGLERISRPHKPRPSYF